MPWPPDADVANPEVERADPGSMLNLYQRALAARRASPALRRGSARVLPSPAGVLAYERVAADGGDRRVVLVNFAAQRACVDLDGDWTVEVATDRAWEGAPFDGELEADAALVLRP